MSAIALVSVWLGEHPITVDLGFGNLQVTTGANWWAVLDAGQAHVGRLLSYGDAERTVAGMPEMWAIEAGTDDLAGTPVPTGARVVVAGWVYAGQTDYSASGKVLLGNTIEWLTESSAAAAIALVVQTTSHASYTNTKAALEGLGHTVTGVLEANIGTTDFTAYDCVVVARSTPNATVANGLRAVLDDDGVPMLVGQVCYGQTAGAGRSTVATLMDLCGTCTLVSSTALADSIDFGAGTSASMANTKAALEGLGHTVTLIPHADIGTTDFTAFDCVVAVRCPATATVADGLRAVVDDDNVPMLVGLLGAGQLVGGGRSTVASLMSLCGTSTVVYPAGDMDNINITNTTHEITDEFGAGELQTAVGNNAWAAVEGTHIGEELSLGSADGGAAFDDYVESFAIESGTDDQDDPAVPTGARIVVAGWAYAGLTDYSADGKTLLGATIDWLLRGPKTGGGGVELAPVGLAGSGTYEGPVYAGDGGIGLAAVGLAGTGLFTSADSVGGGGLVLSPVGLGGTGAFTAPDYPGGGGVAFAPVALGGVGVFSPPTYPGSGTLRLAPLALMGRGSYTPPPCVRVQKAKDWLGLSGGHFTAPLIGRDGGSVAPMIGGDTVAPLVDTEEGN